MPHLLHRIYSDYLHFSLRFFAGFKWQHKGNRLNQKGNVKEKHYSAQYLRQPPALEVNGTYNYD